MEPRRSSDEHTTSRAERCKAEEREEEDDDIDQSVDGWMMVCTVNY